MDLIHLLVMTAGTMGARWDSEFYGWNRLGLLCLGDVAGPKSNDAGRIRLPVWL